MGHHLPGGGGSIEYNNHFITNLLTEYGDIIIFYLAGHTHSDEYRLVGTLVRWGHHRWG